MTAYNVVSPSAMVTGQSEDISVILANFNAIATILNGNLDTANWATGKIFAPAKITQSGASVGMALIWNGTDWVPLALAHAVSNITDPLGTSNTNYRMQGINKQITPLGSGRVKVTIDGQYSSTGIGAGKASMVYGLVSGGIPANDAALTGTTIGNEYQPNVESVNAGTPFSMTREVSGLTPSTPYWFDIAIARVSSPDFALGRMTFVADELL